MSMADIRVFRDDRLFMREIHHMVDGSEEELQYFAKITENKARHHVSCRDYIWRVEARINEPETPPDKFVHKRSVWDNEDDYETRLDMAGVEEGDEYIIVPLKLNKHGDCPACGTLGHLMKTYGDPVMIPRIVRGDT